MWQAVVFQELFEGAVIENIPYQSDELRAGEHLCNLDNKAILLDSIISSRQINEDDTRDFFFIKAILTITGMAWPTSTDIRKE